MMKNTVGNDIDTQRYHLSLRSLSDCSSVRIRPRVDYYECKQNDIVLLIARSNTQSIFIICKSKSCSLPISIFVIIKFCSNMGRIIYSWMRVNLWISINIWSLFYKRLANCTVEISIFYKSGFGFFIFPASISNPPSKCIFRELYGVG